MHCTWPAESQHLYHPFARNSHHFQLCYRPFGSFCHRHHDKFFVIESAPLHYFCCRVPASSVSIEVGGVYQSMSKTTDNYWLATSGPYTFPFSVQITSILGDMVTDVVNVAAPSGAVVGAAQFPLSAAYETVGGDTADLL